MTMDPVKLNTTLGELYAFAAATGLKLTPDDVRYQITHYNEDRAPALYAGSIALITITAVCVALRLFARKVKKIPLGADDYMVLTATVSKAPISDEGSRSFLIHQLQTFAWGMFVAMICCTYFSFGISHGLSVSSRYSFWLRRTHSSGRHSKSRQCKQISLRLRDLVRSYLPGDKVFTFAALSANFWDRESCILLGVGRHCNSDPWLDNCLPFRNHPPVPTHQSPLVDCGEPEMPRLGFSTGTVGFDKHITKHRYHYPSSANGLAPEYE